MDPVLQAVSAGSSVASPGAVGEYPPRHLELLPLPDPGATGLVVTLPSRCRAVFCPFSNTFSLRCPWGVSAVPWVGLLQNWPFLRVPIAPHCWHSTLGGVAQMSGIWEILGTEVCASDCFWQTMRGDAQETLSSPRLWGRNWLESVGPQIAWDSSSSALMPQNGEKANASPARTEWKNWKKKSMQLKLQGYVCVTDVTDIQKPPPSNAPLVAGWVGLVGQSSW